MIAGIFALLCAALFAGAALYISVGEQPARMQLDDRAMLSEWKPAYRAGTAMQAPLAVLSFLGGITAWWQTELLAFLLGAAFMIANLPWTIVVMMPTNKRLMAMDPTADAGIRYLIGRWGKLHLLRTGLGLAGAVCFAIATVAFGDPSLAVR